jgi:hypothetical protein
VRIEGLKLLQSNHVGPQEFFVLLKLSYLDQGRTYAHLTQRRRHSNTLQWLFLIKDVFQLFFVLSRQTATISTIVVVTISAIIIAPAIAF